MIDNPYAIAWKNYCTNETGVATLSARNRNEAQYFFLTSHPIGKLHNVLVEGVELDVKQAELDVAMFVAYRARQTHPKRSSNCVAFHCVMLLLH